MSDGEPGVPLYNGDIAPGDERADGTEILAGIRGYLVGLGLSVLATVVAFFLTGTSLVWQPSIPAALIVLANPRMRCQCSQSNSHPNPLVLLMLESEAARAKDTDIKFVAPTISAKAATLDNRIVDFLVFMQKPTVSKVQKPTTVEAAYCL